MSPLQDSLLLFSSGWRFGFTCHRFVLTQIQVHLKMFESRFFYLIQKGLLSYTFQAVCFNLDDFVSQIVTKIAIILLISAKKGFAIQKYTTSKKYPVLYFILRCTIDFFMPPAWVVIVAALSSQPSPTFHGRHCDVPKLAGDIITPVCGGSALGSPPIWIFLKHLT